jgi:hypothetical protein
MKYSPSMSQTEQSWFSSSWPGQRSVFNTNTLSLIFSIWGYHCSEYENYSLLGCDTMQCCRKVPTLQSNIPLLEAGSFPIWVHCQMPSTNNFTNLLPCYGRKVNVTFLLFIFFNISSSNSRWHTFSFSHTKAASIFLINTQINFQLVGMENGKGLTMAGDM